MSNSTNTVKKSSGQESTTESSMKPQSSLTCVSSSSPVALTSTEDLLMWLQQDSPASPSQLSEDNKEKMTTEICGHKPSISFAEYDHDTACWRTSQGCLLTNMQDEYLETWPKAGLMLDGVCYPQPKWERHISVIESGLLPTPAASDYKGGRSPEAAENCGRGENNNFRDYCRQIHGLTYPIPAHMEAMMDWPIGWSEPKPLEMDKYQQWLQRHGDY